MFCSAFPLLKGNELKCRPNITCTSGGCLPSEEVTLKPHVRCVTVCVRGVCALSVLNLEKKSLFNAKSLKVFKSGESVKTTQIEFSVVTRMFSLGLLRELAEHISIAEGSFDYKPFLIKYKDVCAISLTPIAHSLNWNSPWLKRNNATTVLLKILLDTTLLHFGEKNIAVGDGDKFSFLAY